MSKFDPVLILAGVLGLDTSTPKDTQMIAYCCEGIEDMWAFIDYCKDKYNGISYAKPAQKLSTLSENYKKIEYEVKMKERYKKIGIEVSLLIEKIKDTKNYIKHDNAKWQELNIAGTSECYFSNKEQKLLKALGSEKYVVELLETHKLDDELLKIWKKSLEPKKSYELLDAKIKNLLQGAKNDNN
ncbi:MAG: hypothetical protein WC253_04380 [Sulfurovaceae bacterium]